VTTDRSGYIPDWDIHERLAKALKHSGLTTEELAARLGVSPNTVRNWVHGHVKRLSRAGVLVWAQETGVDADWLLTGNDSADSESFNQCSSPKPPVEGKNVSRRSGGRRPATGKKRPAYHQPSELKDQGTWIRDGS
jgi:transcriptional regulator with XRE-family HTH domain